MIRIIIFIAVSLFTFQLSIGQTNELDSLIKQLSQMGDDTNKVNLLIEIFKQKHYEFPGSGSQLKSSEQAIALAEKNNLLKEKVKLISKAEEAMKTFRETGDKVGESKMLVNIGSAYLTEGLNERAINYYIQAIKLHEEVRDTFSLLSTSYSIGLIYALDESTYDSALLYFNDLLKNSWSPYRAGLSLVEIGNVYLKKQMLDSALYFFKKSIAFYRNQNNSYDPYAYSKTFNLMGNVHCEKGNYDSAITYHIKAIQIISQLPTIPFNKSNNTNNLLIANLSLAETYRRMARLSDAIKIYEGVLSIAKDLGGSDLRDIEIFKKSYTALTDIYEDMGQYDNAYKYLKKLMIVESNLENAAVNFKQEIKELEWSNAEKEYVLRQNILEADVLKVSIVRNFSFIIGGILILVASGIVYQYRSVKKKNKIISIERKKSDDLLLNILPESTANELKLSGHVNPRKYDLSTVLFTDFTGFTKQSESISPEVLVNSLDYYFQEFDRITEKHNLEKIKTIGDAYMCVGGIPTPNDKNPVDVLKAAIDMLNFVTKVVPDGIEKFEIRLGIHTGPIIAGIVGIKKFQYDVWGNTVNIASLMESSSEPHKINISQATYEYVKDDFNCIYRGEVEAKHGERMDMYFVEV